MRQKELSTGMSLTLRAATALLLVGTATLSGCYALIAKPLREATMGVSEFDKMVALPVEHYRGWDCNLLASQIQSNQELRNRNLDEPEIRDGLSTILSKQRQASAEKGCTTSQGTAAAKQPPNVVPATAAAASRPAASGAPGVPSATGSTGHLGVRLGSVDATMAKALGLKTQRGAMVVEVDSPAPSGGNGLKPLDVVLEIAGQAVTQPADLQSTVQRMRPGYKAPLRIWRDRAERDLVVVIGTAPVAQQQPVAPAASQPERAVRVSAPPAGQPHFCHAMLRPIGKLGGVESPVWEERSPDYSHAALRRYMAGFLSHARQLQPGTWHDDLSASSAQCATGFHDQVCIATAHRSFGTPQRIAQFCHDTREQAEEKRKAVRAGEVLTVIEWTPPAVP